MEENEKLLAKDEERIVLHLHGGGYVVSTLYAVDGI
jgi:acetyl esterase/lipase